jgi:hypothetical protein
MAHYRFFAKSPLYVRTGAGSAQVVVLRSERGRIAVSWGNTDHHGTVRVGVGKACPAQRPTPR